MTPVISRLIILSLLLQPTFQPIAGAQEAPLRSFERIEDTGWKVLREYKGGYRNGEQTIALRTSSERYLFLESFTAEVRDILGRLSFSQKEISVVDYLKLMTVSEFLSALVRSNDEVLPDSIVNQSDDIRQIKNTLLRFIQDQMEKPSRGNEFLADFAEAAANYGLAVIREAESKDVDDLTLLELTEFNEKSSALVHELADLSILSSGSKSVDNKNIQLAGFEKLAESVEKMDKVLTTIKNNDLLTAAREFGLLSAQENAEVDWVKISRAAKIQIYQNEIDALRSSQQLVHTILDESESAKKIEDVRKAQDLRLEELRRIFMRIGRYQGRSRALLVYAKEVLSLNVMGLIMARVLLSKEVSKPVMIPLGVSAAVLLVASLVVDAEVYEKSAQKLNLLQALNYTPILTLGLIIRAKDARILVPAFIGVTTVASLVVLGREQGRQSSRQQTEKDRLEHEIGQIQRQVETRRLEGAVRVSHERIQSTLGDLMDRYAQRIEQLESLSQR